MELVELVNSVSFFFISNDLIQMVNFPIWILDYDSHSLALLDLFLSSDASICSTMAFPPLGTSNVVISVSIVSPSNSKGNAPFHRIVYDYSPVDWDGLRNHLRDVPWDIFKLAAFAGSSKFCDWFQESMYISLIVNIRLSFTHPHDFSCFCCYRSP